MVFRFWDLTPDEFAVHVECFQRQEARTADRMAILVCNLRPAIWGKKRLKPKDILGRPLVSEQRKRRRTRTTDSD